MKRRIPIIAAAFVASFFLFEMLFVHPRIKLLKEYLTDFSMVLIAFATVMMALEVVVRESRKVVDRRMHPDWPFSAVLLVAFVTMATMGIVGGKEHDAFRWMFDFLYHPLQSSLVALVAFTTCVAILRVARSRPVEASILLGVAVVVMLARVPLGHWMSPSITEVGQWLARVPGLALRRAILLGAAVGAIGMFLRVVLGLDGAPTEEGES